jgi:hypothetical protein
MVGNALLGAYDVGLGIEIGLASCIPVIAVIYMGESDRCAGFRQRLASHRFVQFIQKGMS